MELTGLLATCHLQLSAEVAFAASPEFTIAARDAADFHIVALHGELDLASRDGLADALVELAGSTVVVDLSGLTFVDAAGISALAVARDRILAAGQGQLVVTSRKEPSEGYWKSWNLALGSWNGHRSGMTKRFESDLCRCCGGDEIATYF